MLLVRVHNSVFHGIQRLLDDWAIGTAARVVFAGVLFVYFWNSAMTKIGDGLLGFLSPSVGAYAQILPKKMEAVSFDPSALSTLDHVIVYAGTYSEIILPICIVVGLFTRLAAIGMIGFVAVMTWTDITQHGVDAATIGSWFDAQSGSAIADQRSLWVFLLFALVVKGPGPLSLDALLGRMRGYN
ncbi:MAG: DoxX family protein [Pseudomonadota bacterium]